MINFAIILIVTVGILLAEIVVATGLILKQFSLLRNGKDPMQAMALPKVKYISKQAAKFARETAIAKQMENG